MDATSMVGMTVLFTGASRGVGRAAAIEMAHRGAEVLIVGHDETRGAGEFLLADMADAGSVQQLAGRVLARPGGLHVLLHNVGGFPPAGRRTAEGVDASYALNFLGAWLLTRLLEEKLFASAPARVIAVSSEGHRRVKKFRLDALGTPGTTLSQMEAPAAGSADSACSSVEGTGWAGQGANPATCSQIAHRFPWTGLDYWQRVGRKDHGPNTEPTRFGLRGTP